MSQFLPVYNVGRDRFFENEDLTIASFLASDDYVSTIPVAAKDLEDLFEILNINHPADFIERVNQLHEQGHRIHSSLSVGDVVVMYSAEPPRYFQCMSCGWMELK